MGCPNCGSDRVRWRSGVYFDNEKICFACWFTWDPSQTGVEVLVRRNKEEAAKKLLKEEADRQEWIAMSGGGMDARN